MLGPLLLKIDRFRSSLSAEQRTILKNVWPKKKISAYRIAVLKVIPKIHKLLSIDEHSWKNLPSRPIRGGENCPINPPSKALCTLLQNMLKDVRAAFPKMVKMSRFFPCIRGCDEYSQRVKNTPLKTSLFTKTTLLSADFGDAYTMSQLAHLKESVEYIGNILHYTVDMITW